MNLQHLVLAHVPLALGKGPGAASAPLGALWGQGHFIPLSPHTPGLPLVLPSQVPATSQTLSQREAPIPTIPISRFPWSACPSFALPL